MHSLTFRLLEVFVAVVDQGSITAASNKLSLSQPTVSLQIKKLVEQIGLPLLSFEQGKVKLTEAGQSVYRCAQEVLSAQARLNTEVAALHGIEAGSLRIAVVTTAKYVIPPVLSRFCRAHPNIDLRFTIGNRAQIIDRLHQNKDDLYIFSKPPESDELNCLPFMSNPLQIIAPPNYDGPDNCSLADLKEQKFLLRETGSGTRYAFDSYCAKHDIQLNRTMIIESNEAIRLSVASGLGIAVISEHTLAQSAKDSVRVLKVTDFPLLSSWQAVTLKHRPLSPAVNQFQQTLLSALNNEK